jgi:hypothetical protein
MIKFRHITLASKFYTTKFSANRQNTEYTVGNRTDQVVQGIPSVLYDEVVFCKELKIIYTHGAFYEANSAQFDQDAFITKWELIDNYVNKTDLDNYYTKPQTDNTFVKKSTLENNYYDKDTTFDLFVTKNRLISDYFNKSDIEENYYTKRQTNNLLDQKQDTISGEGVISVEDNVVKADLSDYYNKSEVDTKLDQIQDQDTISGEGVISVEDNVVKADLSDYYNKSEVDNLLDQKQDTISGEGVISVEDNVVKADLSDYYNKSEVDNKLSILETNIDWKEAVATYADIATTYPSPQDGWTVNVKDTDYTYRWDGTNWIAISANAIPLATTSVNGLMTTAMVTKLDGIQDGAEVNVQSDWLQSNINADGYIKNKPIIPTITFRQWSTTE